MQEFILLMHLDAADSQLAADPSRWESYITRLQASGQLESAHQIGAGLCYKKDMATVQTISPLSSYLKVRATDQEQAQKLLIGNPIYEAGGTVEIRQLAPLLLSQPMQCDAPRDP